jgi:hypothetical protein
MDASINRRCFIPRPWFLILEGNKAVSSFHLEEGSQPEGANETDLRIQGVIGPSVRLFFFFTRALVGHKRAFDRRFTRSKRHHSL